MSTLCLLFRHRANGGRSWLAPSSWMLVTYYAVVAHVVHQRPPISRTCSCLRVRPLCLGLGSQRRQQQEQQQQERLMSSTASSSINEQQQQQQQQQQQSIDSDETATSTRSVSWLESASSIPPPVYDPTRSYFPIYYNDVYEVTLPPHHRFPMGKYAQVRKRVQDSISQIISDCLTSGKNEEHRVVSEFRVSPLATLEELTTTHSPDYVARYMRGDQTERELRNVGFPWSMDGVRRSLSSTGGTVAAAKAVCEALRIRQQQQQQQQMNDAAQQDQRQQYEKPLIWAAHVAGGTHHAFYDRGEGFCVFSDIAVAANVVRRLYPDVIRRRILILDLDVHQGNGNAVLFQGCPEVVTFSLHCKANYFSPKEQSDVDVELPAGCTDETYLGTLQHWLRQIKRQGGRDYFDLVFFQAGVDVLEEDRLGRMALTQQGVRRRNEMVYDFCQDLRLPLVITMGGGYPRNEESWNPILDAHANVYVQAWQYLQKNG